MNRSLGYAFLRNMWIEKRVDEKFLQMQVRKEYLTSEEVKEIVSATQKD